MKPPTLPRREVVLIWPPVEYHPDEFVDYTHGNEAYRGARKAFRSAENPGGYWVSAPLVKQKCNPCNGTGEFQRLTEPNIQCPHCKGEKTALSFDVNRGA